MVRVSGKKTCGPRMRAESQEVATHHEHSRIPWAARVYQLTLSALAAATAIAALEWLLLSPVVKNSFEGKSLFLLPALLWGVSLVWTLAAAASVLTLDAFDRLLARPRSIRVFWPCLAVALLVLPYSLWLANLTFSGPTVKDLWFQPALVALASIAICIAFASYAWVALSRPKSDRAVVLFGAGMLGLGLACVLTNKYVLPNEYEPIHRFVSIAAVLLCVVGFDYLLRPAHLMQARSASLQPIAAGLSAVLATALAASSFVLSSQRAAWGFATWGETGVARYLPTPSGRSEETTVVGDTPPIKPMFDSAEIRALRAERAKTRPPHFVLFYIDNVQTDHVGAYGYKGNPTTPNIDALARRGAIFRRAYSAYPFTRNFASQLITGRFIGSFDTHAPPRPFIDESLTRQLKQRGYSFFVHNYFDLSTEQGFDPSAYGIDTAVPQPHRNDLYFVKTWPNVPVESLFSKLKEHLEQPGMREKPAFIWVHIIWPHWKGEGFGGSPEFDFGSGLLDHYDSAIAASDAWLPKFRSLLEEKLDHPENTVWFIGSDHGAGVTRQQRQVGKTLYEDHVRVPLIIQGPGVPPGDYDFVVDSALDVAATLLDFAGLPISESWDGVSLLPLMQGNAEPSPRAIPLMYKRQWQGMVFDNWKYIAYGNTTQLFDLSTDPLERRNLADSRPEVVDRLGRATLSVLSSRIKA
ncbi:MAG: sulfatase-like hydrolase/transferase, partial [Deltaproteobacteria bacterium]|nr:sulfatase-like hydrolase/transferase [Deltaproteobacteria bacterium]